MNFKLMLFDVIGFPVDRERRLRIGSFCLAGGIIGIAYFGGVIHYNQLDLSRSSLCWILWRHHFGAFENHFWIIATAYVGFVVWPSNRIAKVRGLKSKTIWAMALPAFVAGFFVLTKLFEPNIQY